MLAPTRRAVIAGAAGLAVSSTACANLPSPAPEAAPRKRLVFVRRRPDLDAATFQSRWRTAWTDTLARDSGISGLVLHEITATTRRPDIPAGEDIVFDAIAEVWSAADGRLPAIDAALVSASLALDVRETVVIPAVRGDVCLIAVLRRRPEASHDGFVRHWIDVHGATARSVPRVRGLVLDEVVAAHADPSSLLAEVGEIDGVAQSYRDDPTRPLDSPEAAAWYADGAASIGHARTYRTLEHVVKPPG